MKQQLNEQFVRMQKLAGIITENETNNPTSIKMINGFSKTGPMADLANYGVYDFSDGFLGSTGHGVSYYYTEDGQDSRKMGLIGNFESVKNKIANTTIESTDWDDNVGEDKKEEYFNKYSGAYIMDYSSDGFGAGDLMVVDPKTQTIELYSLPINEEGIFTLNFDKNLNIIPNPETEDYINV
jgi:hypothetical protein